MEIANLPAILREYSGKKVLITGHTGFKGAWLAIWLNSLGAKVSGFALDPEFSNGIFVRSGIGNLIKDHRGDIRNLTQLCEAFEEEQPEVVFHLAAQPLVLESYKNPVLTFETNVQGTVNVLEAIRRTSSVKAAVMITTDKCYENKEWVWGYRETDPMGGHDPYSASKGAAEIVISSYRRSFFSESGSAAIASARAGNVIGGGDESANRLVPDIMKALKRNEDILIRNPFSVRPWQHVLEPLSGYLMLGIALVNKPDRFAEGWNFGPWPNSVVPVGKLADLMVKYVGNGSWKSPEGAVKVHEAGLLMLDISKAVNLLQWKPLLSIEQALQYTADWYFREEGTNMLAFTEKQIETYTNEWNSGN